VTDIDNRIERGNDGIDLLALWQTIWSYKYIIIAATVVGGGVAAAVALAQSPIYRAEVVITKVRDGGRSTMSSLANQFGGLANIAGINLGTSSDDDREAQAILESRKLVEEFVARGQLLPQLGEDGKKPPTLWQAVRHFRESVLSIREDSRKGRITVAVEWTDPGVAASWANNIVALANELIRTRALDGSKKNIAYLKEQIARTDVVEMQRVMYNLIEAETKTQMLANAKAEYAFTVVDPAVPPEVRIRPRRSLIGAIGVMIGFAGGLIFSFLHSAFVRTKA